MAALVVFHRFGAFGPLLFLLFLGLALAIDPGMVAEWAGKFRLALGNFERQLRAERWRELWPEPEPVEISRRARMALRCAGVALAALAFLGLAGFAS